MTESQIKFADNLVASVLNETKEATVRYDGFESVQVGDTLTAVTTDGTPFAELNVKRTASASAIEAHDILQAMGANYPSTSPQDVIDALNKHYSDPIVPSTPVQVLVYELSDRLDNNY
jgi:hypothetical protein